MRMSLFVLALLCLGLGFVGTQHLAKSKSPIVVLPEPFDVSSLTEVESLSRIEVSQELLNSEHLLVLAIGLNTK